MTSIIALAEGTELVGDYTVERVLGAGGFGITYLAREKALKRLVTIKEYFPSDFAARKDGLEAVPRSQDSTSDYDWGLERFVAEAEILARFKHPHIVGVHRYFRANNTAYMVLQYEEGQSLKDWLKSLGRVPRQADLDRVVAPLLDALEVVHSADFLHRDIAPDNIIIRSDGQPVLIDFGAARGEIARHSKTISALVKPGYSPYEQYAEKNSRQGPWTDIYALGATLYYAITKKRPPDAVLRVTKDEYRSVGEIALGSYRKRFLRAIDRSLAVDIGSRPQSVAAWRGELLGPDEPKRSWLTGRAKSAGPSPGSDLELDDGLPEPPDDRGEVPAAPPPPDAPGRRGGMLDFVDNLKKPGARPLAQALRGGSDADAAVQTNPNERAREEPGKSPPAAEGPSPGGTVRVDPPPAAPLFPKRRKAAAEARAAPPPGPAARPAAEPDRSAATEAAPAARAAPLPVPVPAEPQRKPPRPPGGELSRIGSRIASGLARVILIGALAFVLYANRDRLAAIGSTGLAELNRSLTGPGAGAPASPAAPPPPAKPLREAKTVPARTASVRTALPERRRTISAHDGPVKALAFDDTGSRILTAGAEGSLRIWSGDTGALERIVSLDHGPPTALAVRDRYAATGHKNGHTAVWDLEAGTKIADLRRNEAPVWSLAFTRAGRLAIASHDWTVSLWDIRKPDGPIHVFSEHKNPVQAVAHAWDSDLLAAGGADKDLRLFDLNTLDEVRAYRRQSDFITAIAFSPDDRLVASGTLSGTISVFRTNSRSRIERIRDHQSEVTAIAFSPDGRLMVSASNDSTVRVRETRRWRTLKTLPDHQGPVTTVAFSPDGRTFATSGADGQVRLWNTDAFLE